MANENDYEYTPILKFRKVLSGAFLDIADLFYNFDKMDDWPQVIAEGKNSQLEYRKWSDGTFEMWGSGIDDTFNCNVQIRESGLYKCENAVVNFPITVSKVNMLILSGGCNHERSSLGYGHRETEAYVYDQTATSLTYYYVTPMDEGAYSPSNKWAKQFNLYVRGTC